MVYGTDELTELQIIVYKKSFSIFKSKVRYFETVELLRHVNKFGNLVKQYLKISRQYLNEYLLDKNPGNIHCRQFLKVY